ncbi:MAG: hypothetical protein HRT68_16755, partial [Flavobacteriaceae bacterium]|nr:hypothetical protein [Flavobacteriaceae bacterium]
MKYINREFIENLLLEVDIKTIIDHDVELKKKGSSWFGFSPFSNEKTPSFNVNQV